MNTRHGKSVDRSLYRQVEKMSLRLPKCEFCKHFRGYKDRGIKCEAFPDGVPDDKKLFDYFDKSECANGIKFEYEDGNYTESIPEPGSLLAKMHRI